MSHQYWFYKRCLSLNGCWWIFSWIRSDATSWIFFHSWNLSPPHWCRLRDAGREKSGTYPYGFPGQLAPNPFLSSSIKLGVKGKCSLYCPYSAFALIILQPKCFWCAFLAQMIMSWPVKTDSTTYCPLILRGWYGDPYRGLIYKWHKYFKRSFFPWPIDHLFVRFAGSDFKLQSQHATPSYIQVHLFKKSYLVRTSRACSDRHQCKLLVKDEIWLLSKFWQINLVKRQEYVIFFFEAIKCMCFGFLADVFGNANSFANCNKRNICLLPFALLFLVYGWIRQWINQTGLLWLTLLKFVLRLCLDRVNRFSVKNVRPAVHRLFQRLCLVPKKSWKFGKSWKLRKKS